MGHSKEMFIEQTAYKAEATEEAENRAFLARCNAQARAIGLIEEVIAELPVKLFDLEDKLRDALALLEGRPTARRVADDFQSEADAAWRSHHTQNLHLAAQLSP